MAGSSKASILRYFKKGAEIEVSSDDEGFRGSLYMATVIKPPKTESCKVEVEYETLVEDDEGTRRLREPVALVYLRPRPPRENRLVFQFSDEVDAYHNDGWWEGVITKVLEGGRYAVFFRGTREQLEFKADELRLHREWVSDMGMWVPPLDPPDDAKSTPSAAEVEANEEVTEHIFKPGDLVEASSDEPGFEEAWFDAKIIEKTTADKYLIEYQLLKNDDDTGLLREEAVKSFLRPVPPDIGTVDSFLVDEKVDAWYNDGWWTGVISKVLKNDRYAVYFETSEEEIKFEHKMLRVHQEWRNGKWETAS